MTDMPSKSRRCVAILALAMATIGSAQDNSSIPTELNKPRAIWKGVEVIETAWTYTRVSPAAGHALGNGFEKIVIKFTYIEETDFVQLPGTDGDGRWRTGTPMSQKVSWNVYRKATATGWMEITCSGSGDLELVGMSRAAIEESLKVPCKQKMLSYPNAYWGPSFPSALPLKLPRIVEWSELRDGRSYSEELPWAYGRHTYSVEVKKIVPCGEYNSMTAKPDLAGKAGEIQIVPDTSSILPDGRTFLHITFMCDSRPVKNAKLEVSIEPQSNSGGHMHDVSRPLGKLDGVELTYDKPTSEVYTDSDGKVDVLFEPGKGNDSHHLGIAGIYKVTAKGQNDSEGSAVVVAEVKDLKPLIAGDGYGIGREHTDAHPEGSYATAATLAAIPKLAKAFNEAQLKAINKEGCKNDFKPHLLSANDAALPTGGYFDIGAKWKGSHQTHGEGKGVDFNRFRDLERLKLFKYCDPEYPDVTLQAWMMITLFDVGEPDFGEWDMKDMASCELQLPTAEGGPAQCIPLLHLHFTQ